MRPQNIRHRVCDDRLFQTFPAELQRCGMSVSNVVRICTMNNGPVHLCNDCVRGFCSVRWICALVHSPPNTTLLKSAIVVIVFHSLVYKAPVSEAEDCGFKARRGYVHSLSSAPLVQSTSVSICLSEGECADRH